MTDDDWTFVPRKKKQLRAPKNKPHHQPQSSKDTTLEDIAKDYAAKSRIWKRSGARGQLRRTLTHLKPDAGWQIETAVCLGTGSFSRDNFACSKRTMEQFAMFVDLLEYLQEVGGHAIVAHVQDPYYNDLDKAFLETFGMRVSDFQHSNYNPSDCGPATQYFGPHTFVCELFIEHSSGTIGSLTQSGVPLLVSTSRLMCTHQDYIAGLLKQEDMKRLRNTMDEQYKTLSFPHFEEDPNTFEGLDVLALLPEEEDD